MAAMWGKAEHHVRAARVLLRTGHHGWGPADKQAAKRLSSEVVALQHVLERYRSSFQLPELGKDVEPRYGGEVEGVSDTQPPQPGNGDGTGMVVVGVDADAEQRLLHQQVDAPATSGASSRGPVMARTSVHFLDGLTSELLESICSFMAREERCAFRLSCHAGRDAVRAATTSLKMELNPVWISSSPGSLPLHYLPMQDLSITHKNLKHLKLSLCNQHPYLPTDLPVATPGIFQQLKSLTLQWDRLDVHQMSFLLQKEAHWHCDPDSNYKFWNVVPTAMLRELQQVVALCTELSTLELVTCDIHLVFSAPSDQLLAGLHVLFQDRWFEHEQLIGTLPAQKYLTHAEPKDDKGLRVSSLDVLLRCRRLECMAYSGLSWQQDEDGSQGERPSKLPHGLLALSQLRYLELYVQEGPEFPSSLTVLQDLPQLRHLSLNLSSLQHVDGYISPASLHLPALQHLDVAAKSESCFVSLLAAISAPQLATFCLNDVELPIPVVLEFASRHPAAELSRPSKHSTCHFQGTGEQLVAAAHQLPGLLNHYMHLSDVTPHEIQEAVRVAGTGLHRICYRMSYHQGGELPLLPINSLLHELAASCPNLKALELHTAGPGGFTSEGVSALADSLHGLRQLELRGPGHAFDDTCIRNLGRGCPLLHHLTLSGCGSVSDKAVFDLCAAAHSKLSIFSLHLAGFKCSTRFKSFWQRIKERRAMLRKE